ncbi:SET domain protein [Cryptosporidium hominis]|nr:putative histone-lysine N-methyltransferase 1 [Cryptosporidium hominis]PPA64714.1 SET domain protein [Cryptosporidium hominis]
MTVESARNSKRKGANTNFRDRELVGENKKRRCSHSSSSKNSNLQSERRVQSRSRKNESCMNVFVQADDNNETELVKLNTIEIKNLKDGFKYVGYRCRVAVSRQKTKELENNSPNAFNWVEGIIKFWDPKFKLFFIHFLLSPSINSFRNINNTPKHEWKYLATQNNSPPANTDIRNLVLSPFAIDRGWFDPNPITMKLYGSLPLKDISSISFEDKAGLTKSEKFPNEVCTRCKLPIIKEEVIYSCELCSRKFHQNCVNMSNTSIQDLKDSDITTLRQYNSPNNLELLLIANEHNQYIRERKRLWKRNYNVSHDSEGNLSSYNKCFNDGQLPYDLVDVEELERALPNEVKKIILENYNMSHTGIRKLLSKLPDKMGSIIGDHQVKLLCRNYRYNKRNKSIMLTHSYKEEDYSSTITSFESTPSKICSRNEPSVQKSDLIDDIDSKLVFNKVEYNSESSFIETMELENIDFTKDENNPIQISTDDAKNEQLKTSEYKYRCKDCIPCIYCKEPLLRIPVILKPNELPNRSLVYSQIPTKLEEFVVCGTCGICYHGSCGNSFVPPLLFGGNNFNCSNCCKCIHCGYRDNGFMDYASWDSTFSSCIRCCKGFERGQFCSICRKIWTSSWEGEWLQCDICKFWVHYDCDKDLNEPIEFYSNVKNLYNCPACRSNDKSVKYQRILDHFICLDKHKDFASTPLPSYQNYWKVVKIPMDIMTITNNLESKKYDSDEYSFIRDIFRIIYNAQISHMPNHRIFKLAGNILKKITHLFKLLFGENLLLRFFDFIKKEESSMSILVEQIDTNDLKSKIGDEIFENTNSNISVKLSQDYRANNLSCENNVENELAIDLAEVVLNHTKLNLDISGNLRNTISRKQFSYLKGDNNLNSVFGKLLAEFKKCTICQQKSDELLHCLKCGVNIHSKCSEVANGSFVCNSCTACHICSELMADSSIPVISCYTCNKRVHYTCIWQDYEKFMEQSKYSDIPSRTKKRSEGGYNFTNLSGNLKDNRDYICLWKIISSNASPNKSKVLINSPLTAVFGKGYYQYLINEIYLCTECFEAKRYLHSNLFMEKYANEYNRFLFIKVVEFQKLIDEIITKDFSEIYFSEGTKEREIHKILETISRVELKPFDMSFKEENIIICNLCSDRFYCKDFEDLVEIANDNAICSVSLNYICNNCNKLSNKISKNQYYKKNVELPQTNIITMAQESLKEPTYPNSDFPLILNSLISASQFRVTLSKDVNLLLKVILSPLLDQSISVIKKYKSYLEIDKENIKSDIINKYFNSVYFARIIKQTLQSSLLQWFLFYIHQNGLFDFSNLRKDYLQHFYKQNNVNLDDLIQNNTISVIIASIEKMVLSNDFNNKTNQNKLIKNNLCDPDYLSFLGLYSNLLFPPSNFQMFGLGNLNLMNYQAIIDTKMYLEINDSFKEYVLNDQNSQRNSILVTKHKALKGEITQGLTLIKDQIEMDKQDFKLPKLSLFVLIYSFILSKLSKIDDHFSDVDSNRCKYCGRSQNLLLGDQLINVLENVALHKECVLWSLPFVLEPILNNLDMGYESKFETNKKKSEIYSPKYPTFGSIPWPILRKPIHVDINDIIITLNDLNALKCFFCGNSGATIKCSGNDKCFKYYHIDCIFKGFQKNNFEYCSSYQFNNIFREENNSNLDLSISTDKESMVHIRLKYRRVWCNECWGIYKTIIEPETSFSEGLTGGILNTFVSMLLVDIKIVNNFEFQERLQIVNKKTIIDSFVEKIITIFSSPKKKYNSKIKTLIQKLKRIRDSIQYSDLKFEPNMVNNSIILLDPGAIIENKDFVDGKEIMIFLVNYRALRIWKSCRIINNIFEIDNALSLYLCSTFEINGGVKFQIDWIPTTHFEMKKVNEWLITKDLKDDEFWSKIYINGICHKLFGIPLLRDINLKNLFNSFSELLCSESLKDVSHSTFECIIYPNYLSSDSYLDYSNTKKMQLVSDCDARSQIFFGFREEFIFSLIKRKIDRFSIKKLISAFYYRKIFADIMHPELWTSHRQYPYPKKLSKHKGFEFEYCKLGRNEMKGGRINEDLFNIIHAGNNKDPDNVESMNSIHQSLQESSKRNKIQLEDMGPTKLYRYLDLLPYDKRLNIKKSSIHGFGLFAKELIKTGEPIIEYVGELIRNSVADKRESLYKSNGNRDGSCYMFRLDESSVIDATNIGNHARFMNHCCDPNSICKVISIDSQNKHIVIFSKKTINKDEEITYDYQFNVEEASEKIICHCGASNCLGRMN